MEKKSPLKAKPHRYAGQSLDEEIKALVDDKFGQVLWFTGCMITVAIYEWAKYSVDAPPAPKAMTVIALIACSYSIFRFSKTRKKVRKLKQARDGEMAVGQFLESQRKNGAYVFHDLVGDGFNLDHVLIFAKGVFAVETKTYSKPSKGQAVIRIENDSVLVNGHPTSQSINIQLTAQKKWLSGELSKLLGARVEARSALVFPGWFVEGAFSDSELWAMNPKAFAKRLKKLPDLYSQEQVRRLANVLSMHLREPY